MAGHWTPDDIPWAQFDASKVNSDLVKIVKAAAMVESNGRHYATYLCNVFPDDPEFQRVAVDWAEEEVQHGEVLGRWAALADPSFDYDRALARFRDGYKINLEVGTSVRGSQTGELIARCMVEVGTSSYYTAMADATSEPLLKAICRRIAADELRHYATFYRNMKRYLEKEQLRLPRRLRIAFGRIMETEDDELAYAYFSANGGEGPYDRKTCTRAYFERASSLYRPRHLERAITMIFKAVGLNPTGRVSRTITRSASWLMERRTQRLARAA